MTKEEIEGALGICCGNTDAMRDHLHKTLRLLAARSDANSGPSKTEDGWNKGTKALEAHLGDLYGPMGAVYLHYLDRLDLIEHGCGIAGSWPTKRGRELLEALNKVAAP